ncbi:glycerophosphodiester phosphodiesterase [Peribacillus saganii]|uniref:glycerophosphodiester phosphodiesterase n=1 Tax=Peribacillus saganii TaxID=2303992 RepID=UPI0026AD1962|nr:glycerophosphodiester phosphodiesterase [Peribacillus saganii]
MKIYGHRGAAGTHPENTMISFEEARRAGADGIELDVQLTSDGEVVIIHDESLDRTTNGSGFVKDKCLKELQKFDASNKFSHLYGETEIPTLQELIDWLRGNSLLCNIELKNSKFFYPGMEEKVIKLVREARLEDRIILSSFNHYSIVLCKKIAEEIEIAPLYRDGLHMPWAYARSLGAGAIHPDIKAVPNEIIRASIEAGVAVRPYTVNKEKDIENLLAVGCSAIITDFPAKVVLMRDQFFNKNSNVNADIGGIGSRLKNT